VRVGILMTFFCLSANCMAPTCTPNGLIRWPGRRSTLLTAASLAVAMDRSDFDHDDQSTLVLSLVTSHCRAAGRLYLHAGGRRQELAAS
jgi:hypothetical protein